MLLDKDAFRRFSEREEEQAEHLRKALMGRHQKIYQNPIVEVRRLSFGRRFEMMAANAYARTRWMRTLGGFLCEELGATAHDYVPQIPVYHFTILDRRQCVSVCKPQEIVDWEWSEYECERLERVAHGHRPPPAPQQEPTLREMRQAYQWTVAPLKNCLGMIEPAFYVYASKFLGEPYVAHWHGHVLAWGASERAMERAARDVGNHIQALLPYGQAVSFRRVADEDLLQMIWYMMKSPRKQHQLFRRRAGTLKQFKGGMNGVNSVRLYSSMRDFALPDLAVASGRGAQVLRHVHEDINDWIARNQPPLLIGAA